MITPGTIKTPLPHAAILEFTQRTAWTKIVPAKFFCKLFVAMNNTVSPFDMSFRRKTLPALTHYLKSSIDFGMIVL
jgi:hypothetical protein